MAHEPVVSFVEPEPELERDGEHGTEKETSSEVTVSHVQYFLWMASLPQPDSLSDSRYAAHVHVLQTFVEKVTVYRGTGKYTDPDLILPVSQDALKAYKLASLYDKYFKYAEVLAAQGFVKEVIVYLKLILQAHTSSASKPVATR